MKNDETYIASLLASPYDNAIRIDYADWLGLSSHADFLRAEVEWAASWRPGEKPSDTSKLKSLATLCDPVWAFRVSRVPFGVCYASIPADNGTSYVGLSDLLDAERRLYVEIPTKLKAFLLNYCNRVLSPNEFSAWVEDNDTRYIFQLKDPIHEPSSLSVRASNDNSELLEIANDGYGGILMVEISPVSNRRYKTETSSEEVRYFAPDLAPTGVKVANSLPEFLFRLFSSGQYSLRGERL